MSEEIKFIAHFEEHVNAFNVKGDGSAKLQLRTDAQQLMKILSIPQFFQQAFQVTISQWDDPAATPSS